MRRASRIDKNQPEIVSYLASAGLTVVSLAPMGKGFPDLIVSSSTEMWLAEVKDGEAPFTADQVEFHREWRGKPILVWRSLSQVKEFCRRHGEFEYGK